VITRLKLKAGQKGTKALVAKYGDDLVCVRYRYDDATNTRIKTVELIVEKKTLPASSKAKADKALVPVKIGYAETALKNLAKTLGGTWDPDVKLWYLPKMKIKGTELEKHIILDAKDKYK